MQRSLSKTAVLTLGSQAGIFELVPNSQLIIPHALQVVTQVRDNNIPIIHVGIGFSVGYPEVSPRNQLFSTIKEKSSLLSVVNQVNFIMN